MSLVTLIFLVSVVSFYFYISNKLVESEHVKNLHFVQKRVIQLLWPIIAIGIMLYTAYMLTTVYDDGMKV